MSTPGLSSGPDRLSCFCQSILERRGPWPPTEDALAKEFVRFCGIAAFACFETISQLCLELGVSVSVREMPSEIRGHNSSYNGARTITVAEQQGVLGAREHTILHELRELLEHIFVHLGFPIAASSVDREQRAEHFACLVRANLVQTMMVDWLERAEQVEKKWLRYGAYLLIVLGGLAAFTSCILLPALEDQALQFRQQRFQRQPTNLSVPR